MMSNKRSKQTWPASGVPRLDPINVIRLAPQKRWQSQGAFARGMRAAVRRSLKDGMTVSALRAANRAYPDYAVQVVRVMAGLGLVTIR